MVRQEAFEKSSEFMELELDVFAARQGSRTTYLIKDGLKISHVAYVAYSCWTDLGTTVRKEWWYLSERQQAKPLVPSCNISLLRQSRQSSMYFVGLLMSRKVIRIQFGNHNMAASSD